MQEATEIQFHEVCTMFPLMSHDELLQLAGDIHENGLHESILTHEGKVIDGRNRLKACEIAEVEPTFRKWKGKGSLVGFVNSLNFHRRHLNSDQKQKAFFGVEIKKRLEIEIAAEQAAKCSENGKIGGRGKRKPVGTNSKGLSTPKRNARKEASAAVGVNEKYIADAEKISDASPETAARVKSGELTIPQAKQELGLTPPKPAGKCMINGVLSDDPDDVKKLRASGKLGIHVVPEINHPDDTTMLVDVKEEFEERSAMGDDALSDEAWLAALPIRSLLTGSRQAAFDHNALMYRQAEPIRRAFAHGWSRLKPKTTDKLSGPYTWKVHGFLKAKHPREWMLCPATEDGGCGGTGVLPVVQHCPKCSSKGFRLK